MTNCWCCIPSSRTLDTRGKFHLAVKRNLERQISRERRKVIKGRYVCVHHSGGWTCSNQLRLSDGLLCTSRCYLHHSVTTYIHVSLRFINVFSDPIKGKAQCYASLYSDFHEHLWSHNAGKACHREGFLHKLLNIYRIHVLVLSLHIILHE